MGKCTNRNILYKLFDEKEFKKPKFKKHQSATYMLLFLLSSALGFAQKPSTELDTLIVKGINNNKGLKAYQLQVVKYEANINSAFTFDKTNIY